MGKLREILEGLIRKVEGDYYLEAGSYEAAIKAIRELVPDERADIRKDDDFSFEEAVGFNCCRQKTLENLS